MVSLYTISILQATDRWISYGCASLQMPLPDRRPVVHSIECSDLIDTHWWHFQYSRNLIHNTQARESMLALSEI